MRSTPLACLLLLSCASPGPARIPGPVEADAAATRIDGEFLRRQVASISSDEFEGRGPGTRGDLAARAYLVGELKALGLVPGGTGGTWEQPVELVGIRSRLPEKWTFERGGKSIAIAWWEQFVAASGVQAASSRVDAAELVFVGYGIEAPEYVGTTSRAARWRAKWCSY